MTVLKKEQSLYAIPEGVDPELLMKVLGNRVISDLNAVISENTMRDTDVTAG